MFGLLKETWWRYHRQDGRLLSGAVAFYVTLASAPLGVIALAITGALFGEKAAEGELVARLETFLGAELAGFVEGVIARIAKPETTTLATLFSIGLILYVTTRLFEMVRRALNQLWGIRANPIKDAEERLRLLVRRLFVFGMVFLSGASLALFVLARSLIQAATRFVGDMPYLYALAELGTAFGVLTLLVVMAFRFLPDAAVSRTDAWIGAAATAFFLTMGSYVIAAYLIQIGIASAYGAAGSFVIFLLWIYYNTQIFFLGAEFTRTWAVHHGRTIEPIHHASRVVLEDYDSAST